MSQDKKPFTDRRWTDPPAVKVIGHRELSEEEKQEGKNKLHEILRKNGVLKDE
ncbi:hypothetical protein [Paenibacillus popilliae]|uniref:Asparagine synthase n=1 Tax=Paenibacillus popilliae ATCC 14706 TaxID=1212764 RepID=M9LP87_PAEPP|nr:hypothetical protein [Paenibacillus popilliae]GAC42286.1 asparagine synthase [Paenibacillus popilliae ATCC 14706]